MRDAPAITILPALIEKGATIKAHDPQGMEEAKKYLPQGIIYSTSAYEACIDADAVILMTEWNQYRALEFDRLASVMKNRIFIDLRNVYEPDKVRKCGFRYTGVGRS
jgi:UDPglucose 6-dehydrogenase